MVLITSLFVDRIFDTWIWVFPKIGGKPPKWMVKIMKNPIKNPIIFGSTPISFVYFGCSFRGMKISSPEAARPMALLSMKVRMSSSMVLVVPRQ